jgi:tRNA uridine 5-carbamoylmethylation protein Kti12
VIVAGLPGSGKSTFCDDLATILNDDIGTWVSHYDQAKYFSDYGLPIRADQLDNARRWTLQKLKRSFQERVGVVLLECINLTNFEFETYIDEAWENKIPSLCVHFVCDDEEEAQEMANRASWRVPFNVLRDWYREYEYPFGSPGQGVIPIAARGLN